jgi:sulfur carrier protein
MAPAEGSIAVRVNGTPRELPWGTTLLELVQALGLDQRFLVVEHNGEPVLRAQLGGVALQTGDRVELVKPVAGG